MSLPPPTESETMPFAIVCDFADLSGGLIEDSTIIKEVSVPEPIDFTFSLMVRSDLEPPTVPPTTPLPMWTPESLTVTMIEPNGHGLTQSGLHFYGLYSTSIFPSSTIGYLTADYQPVTVDSWDKVPDKNDPNFFQIYAFRPSGALRTTVTFTVTAVIDNDGALETLEKTFTQVVTNNWTGGQNDLLRYM